MKSGLVIAYLLLSQEKDSYLIFGSDYPLLCHVPLPLDHSIDSHDFLVVVLPDRRGSFLNDNEADILHTYSYRN